MCGTFPHEEGDGGSFTGSAASNYCQFLRENCFKGENVYLPHFKKKGCKKIAIYHVMRLVDARETLAKKEGQGRRRKLTKTLGNKVSF